MYILVCYTSHHPPLLCIQHFTHISYPPGPPETFVVAILVLEELGQGHAECRSQTSRSHGINNGPELGAGKLCVEVVWGGAGIYNWFDLMWPRDHVEIGPKPLRVVVMGIWGAVYISYSYRELCQCLRMRELASAGRDGGINLERCWWICFLFTLITLWVLMTRTAVLKKWIRSHTWLTYGCCPLYQCLAVCSWGSWWLE